MKTIEQDANKVIDKLNVEWASDVVKLKKRVAILLEEVERLREENESLKIEEE